MEICGIHIQGTKLPFHHIPKIYWVENIDCTILVNFTNLKWFELCDMVHGKVKIKCKIKCIVHIWPLEFSMIKTI